VTPRERPIVVDCHNDWLLLMARERSLGHTDSVQRRFLPQFRDAGIDVQVTPVYIDPEYIPEAALRRTLLLIRQLKEEVAATQGISICETGGDIDAAVDAGELALVVSLEGSPSVGSDVVLFEDLYELGVRMVSFTHFGDTLLAGGSADGDPGRGLTKYGVEALRIFERLGIVMDVSHLSAQSTDDVLQRATRPLVASHSSARSLRDHHRNLSDEHLKDIAALGGVIGIPVAIPMFIDPEHRTIDRVIDHILHVAEVIGIDHVGIGADFVKEYFDEVYATYDEIESLGEDVRATIEGLDSPAGMPALMTRLRERGVEGDDLDKVLGANFLRVFREVMGVAG
jgi:membrane dipeptidase